MLTSLYQLPTLAPSLLTCWVLINTHRSATCTPLARLTGRMTRGNPKLQCPTYLVLQVTTKYTFGRIVGLIQSYLTEMNVFEKEKEMPSLNTRTRLAIIGMTADWCPVSLWMMLHKDLEHHVEKLQMSGWVDAKF